MKRDSGAERASEATRGHANGAGHGAPASERVGESEGRRPSDEEDEIDRELKRLPLPHAPQTLLPRVLQAVERAARPWYSRAWFTWPWHWRLASAAVVALIAYAFWHLPPAPPSVIAAAGTTRVLWEALIQPLLPYLLVLMVLMGIACAAFGVVLNYVLLERVEQRQ